jgi:HlyD family secretion protein
MASESDSLKVIRQFQSEVSSLREAPDPFSARMTLHAIAAMFIALSLIAVFAKLDRVISSVSGKIVTTTGPTIHQAFDTAIVKSINVHEGDRVAKGDVLATLDPTFAGADVSQLKQQAASLAAQIIRDQAELQGATPHFPETSDPDQSHYNQLQAELYADRAGQYRAQLNSYGQKLQQTSATLTKLQAELAHLKERSQIAQKVETMRTTLLQKGAGSLLNQLSSTDARVAAQQTEESELNSINEANHQLSSLAADKEAFVRSWSSDLRKDLVTSQNSLDSARAQLGKALRHQESVTIVADQDAIILTVAKTSVGSVLREGDPIVTSIPLASPIEAEIRMAARDVGFVRAGDDVVLKVDAFNFTEHGTAEGKVKWISEGAFVVNDDTGQPTDAYYRARVSVDKMDFIKVPANFRLIPGMTLSADVNVGSRSLWNYVIDGLLRGASGAMREP